jgi:hypothetical protein
MLWNTCTTTNTIEEKLCKFSLYDNAGAGDICLAVRDLGVLNVDCFEINSDLVEALTLLGFPPLEWDFLEATPRPIYDRVVMNPPFGRDAHIDHVRAAYNWLAPGGEDIHDLLLIYSLSLDDAIDILLFNT